MPRQPFHTEADDIALWESSTAQLAEMLSEMDSGEVDQLRDRLRETFFGREFLRFISDK